MTKLSVEELDRVRMRRQKRKSKSKRRKSIRAIKSTKKPINLAKKLTEPKKPQRAATIVEIPDSDNQQWMLHGIEGVNEQLVRSLGLTVRQIEPVLRNGGDAAEKQFMECCWCLWKANGSDLIEPFIEAAFNLLPERSRSVLFERMMTIVYVAQNGGIKSPST